MHYKCLLFLSIHVLCRVDQGRYKNWIIMNGLALWEHRKPTLFLLTPAGSWKGSLAPGWSLVLYEPKEAGQSFNRRCKGSDSVYITHSLTDALPFGLPLLPEESTTSYVFTSDKDTNSYLRCYAIKLLSEHSSQSSCVNRHQLVTRNQLPPLCIKSLFVV